MFASSVMLIATFAFAACEKFTGPYKWGNNTDESLRFLIPMFTSCEYSSISWRLIFVITPPKILNVF